MLAFHQAEAGHEPMSASDAACLIPDNELSGYKAASPPPGPLSGPPGATPRPACGGSFPQTMFPRSRRFAGLAIMGARGYNRAGEARELVEDFIEEDMTTLSAVLFDMDDTLI